VRIARDDGCGKSDGDIRGVPARNRFYARWISWRRRKWPESRRIFAARAIPFDLDPRAQRTSERRPVDRSRREP
jgi:hypothetical protein